MHFCKLYYCSSLAQEVKLALGALGITMVVCPYASLILLMEEIMSFRAMISIFIVWLFQSMVFQSIHCQRFFCASIFTTATIILLLILDKTVLDTPET